MKIIVTGGAGFIGSHLVDKLVKRGGQVFVIDNLATGKKENLNPRAAFLRGDIRNASFLLKAFSRVRPALVFHLAAIPRVPLSVKDPVGTSETNIGGTLRVFQAAKEARVKRVVFASSSSVYGDQKTFPLTESMRPLPKSPYGLQKFIGEEWGKIFSSLYHMPVISLRYFNVYGPRIDFDSEYSLLIGKFLRLKAEGKPLTIFGTGRQTRAFCYVDDVVEATIKAAHSQRLRGGEIINIGGATSDSVERVAGIIGGKRKYFPPRPGDVLHTKADLARAKKLLSWEPIVSLEEGVVRTKQWFEGVSLG